MANIALFKYPHPLPTFPLMHIAIIGSGAAGLVSAWLLQPYHQVEILEREPIPGGHVRTLNRNVKGSGLPPEVSIENGVLGFHRESYPTVIRLMEKLKVPLLDDQPSARLYRGQSAYPVSLKTLWRNAKFSSLGRRAQDAVTLIGMALAHRRFLKELSKHGIRPDVESILTQNNTLRELQKAVLMLSFSTPYDAVDQLPARLVEPYFRALIHREWCYVEGGVFRYMEEILRGFKGKLHLNVEIMSVVRHPSGVELVFQNGERRAFDKVIFAIPPGKILSMLHQPTDAERMAFAPWKNREFVTIAHTDDQMYNGFDKVPRTPMDLFSSNHVVGYNTSMNAPYGLPADIPYSFAYNLEKYIRPEKILHRTVHTVPAYDDASWDTRERIVAMQGERHSYYAGAWLGNALHEGAVSSAVNVARLLGGQWD
jgi:predicted NAD/FAD-binding protein